MKAWKCLKTSPSTSAHVLRPLPEVLSGARVLSIYSPFWRFCTHLSRSAGEDSHPGPEAPQGCCCSQKKSIQLLRQISRHLPHTEVSSFIICDGSEPKAFAALSCYSVLPLWPQVKSNKSDMIERNKSKTALTRLNQCVYFMFDS